MSNKIASLKCLKIAPDQIQTWGAGKEEELAGDERQLEIVTVSADTGTDWRSRVQLLWVFCCDWANKALSVARVLSWVRLQFESLWTRISIWKRTTTQGCCLKLVFCLSPADIHYCSCSRSLRETEDAALEEESPAIGISLKFLILGHPTARMSQQTHSFGGGHGGSLSGFEFPSAEFYKELAPRLNWSRSVLLCDRNCPAISDWLTTWIKTSVPNIYGCFQKYGYPQITHFNRVFLHKQKPSTLGAHPYFWKQPYSGPTPLYHGEKIEEVQGLGEGLGPEIGPSLAKALKIGVRWVSSWSLSKDTYPLVYQIF